MHQWRKLDECKFLRVSWLNNWRTVGILCLVLGLAPFFPESHLWGKLKWIWGGAVGMQTMDWVDVLQHGFPFILLLRIGVLKVVRKYKSE